MFSFLKKHPPREGEEREKIKKELFSFKKCGDYGFPSKPCALAYDAVLRLLGVGTKSGAIKVYGAPGVKFSGFHKSDVAVVSLFFLPEEGRLVSVCSDNSVHLWEINLHGGNSVLEEVREFLMENNKMKTISTCCLTPGSRTLLLGTEGGNIYILDLISFTLLDQIIYQDVVMQNVPDDFKVCPGAVEAIAVHPANPEKFLIGYNRGLIVMWNNRECNTEKTYNATQQLESLAWHRSGDEFISSHADGSYITWSMFSFTMKASVTPYGPFPCKAINKLQWKTSKGGDFIIFSGGMPRASYGDRHTISVMQGDENHVVLDFTSRVVDFITVCNADETADISEERDEPNILVVLVEEELVVLDLESRDWLSFCLPYLNSAHASAITCTQHILNVPDQLWLKLIDAGNAQRRKLSKREWPISGGKNLARETVSKDLLITGHEDGTVRFWDVSGTCLSLLYCLATAPFFGFPDHTGESSNSEEDWPPFRKVGTFDPYSDDPRLAIQKIALCSFSETLVVAGTAGQVVVLQMEREQHVQELKASTLNIVSDRDNFVWKGHEMLTPTVGDVSFDAGYHPTCILQLYPPAACTALALHSEWQLVAAGTAHGFGLFDYAQQKEIIHKCTLSMGDMSGSSDTTMSRRKSLKRSLRESFRRLRKGRSERRKHEKYKGKNDEKQHQRTTVESEDIAGEAHPVERIVEARSTEDSMASMVRSVYFADTFIVSGANSPSLWIGTNGGHVYIFILSVPTSDKRSSHPVGSQLAKEIKLKHHAPVINIAVMDGKNHILPAPFEVIHEHAKAPDMGGQHSAIICSEEQLKVFTLPALKPRWKNKITAVDGARLRRTSFVAFRSKRADNYSEFDIACLNNLGELAIYSVASLRRQMITSAIKKEDINGIASFVFTKDGQGFYLQSPSEFCHISLSACDTKAPVCMLQLREGMRPEPGPLVGTSQFSSVQDMMNAAEREGSPEEREVDLRGYDTSDILTGLDESQATDSRTDTSGDITVDSIQDHVNETTQHTTAVIFTETTSITDTANSSLAPQLIA
ncbi:lethal(2) giant larvae protein homolog 1-like isoform X2 [Pomacea canaliculata]|uniref:lethal(2) giant larvae protein homolog 1-like isoform X2 n=1 Tax=Pomacea canaliculata TaxID=400727 RepID=UPI000D739E6F|nr:lethal(2) giant larvae protein homolog 1-like isoform X2 [Pomacea canaliculata]